MQRLYILFWRGLIKKARAIANNASTKTAIALLRFPHNTGTLRDFPIRANALACGRVQCSVRSALDREFHNFPSAGNLLLSQILKYCLQVIVKGFCIFFSVFVDLFQNWVFVHRYSPRGSIVMNS